MFTQFSKEKCWPTFCEKNVENLHLIFSSGEGGDTRRRAHHPRGARRTTGVGHAARRPSRRGGRGGSTTVTGVSARGGGLGASGGAREADERQPDNAWRPATAASTARGSGAAWGHGRVERSEARVLRPVRLAYQPPASSIFSHNKPATSNQSAVLFSQNKSAPATSNQPNEQVVRWDPRDVVVYTSSCMFIDFFHGLSSHHFEPCDLPWVH
jgi:hypothetical protein